MNSYLQLHRLALYVLATLFATFLIWALVFNLDIVVTAQGKLTPLSQVKLIQPADTSLVQKVLVKDGDPVKEGQVLLELDPVQAEEARKAFEKEASLYQNQLQRITAELTGDEPKIAHPVVLAEYQSRRANHMALISEATSTLARARSDLATTEARMVKSSQLAPVAGKQEAMLGKLKDAGFMSEQMYNDKLRDKIETSQELQVQKEAVKAGQAGVLQAERSLDRVKADYYKQLAQEQSDYTVKLANAEGELRKAERRSELTFIKAPVTGTVTNLNVRNAGQVVPSGTSLLSVIPMEEPLQFEGWVRNEDSAFIYPGMPVRVKAQAFPFQKYGWLEGELKWVGVDTDAPETMKQREEPLFYKVRVHVSKQALTRDGKEYPIKPGMQAIADIQVGTRTLFEYLVSPLKKVANESARER